MDLLRYAYMRRGFQLLQKLQQNGALMESMGASGQAMRALSSTPETPLSKFMPVIMGAPRQAFDTALSLTGKLVVAAATSGPVKSLVSSFAEKVVTDEALVKISDLDPSYWAYWLATTGYSSQAGFKKLADAAKSKASQFSPEQVTSLVTGLHIVNYYDKELFDGLAANISSNFTKYETEQLLTIVKAYSEFGHYNAHLFDDIADSITYCNHYLAPIKASTSDVVATLAAYAKHGHVRADFIVSLTRGISEVGLSKLSAETRRDTVIAGIRAFAAFDFYPEQVDALLYYAKANPEAYSADELKDVEKVVSVIEAQTGGQLKTYVESHDESADDWYGHHQTVKSHYELYAFREGLVPASYSPLALRSDLKKK